MIGIPSSASRIVESIPGSAWIVFAVAIALEMSFLKWSTQDTLPSVSMSDSTGADFRQDFSKNMKHLIFAYWSSNTISAFDERGRGISFTSSQCLENICMTDILL